MIFLLLKHLILATNIFGRLIFQCKVKNKYISVFFMNPNLFLSPYFLYSVGAAAGYDTCQVNEALHAIHNDV